MEQRTLGGLIFRTAGLSRFGAAARYFLAVADYGSRRKLWNFVRCEVDKMRRCVHPVSLPYIATVDVTNFCNLRCPYCMTGQGRAGRPRGEIDIGHVQTLVDELGDYLLIANLSNWGESMLSPGISDVVKVFHDRRVFTSLSTNLVLKKKDNLGKICQAGLDYLIMSIDGSTQETYAKYRRGGDLSLVLENVEYLVKYKRSFNLRRPILEWQ